MATTFITALLLLLSAYVLNFTLTELKISTSQAVATQAYYLAESGVAEAIWRLKNDSSWKSSFEDNPSWTIHLVKNNALFSGGSYTIDIVNSGQARGEITVTGKINKGNSTAQRVIKTSVYKAIGESPLADVAEYADGNIDISGSLLNVYNGSLASNNNVIINFWSGVNVDNRVAAGVKIIKHSNSILNAASTLENAPVVPMPAVSFDDLSDLNSFKNKAGSQVYTENQFAAMMNANHNLTLNGVTYVTGDITVPYTQTLTINGALVADKDITIGENDWRCIFSGRANVNVNTQPGSPSGIFSKRKINFELCLGSFNAAGLIYANDQIDILSVPNIMNIVGGVISRKLTLTSIWQGVNITLNEENIISGLGSALFSPVITVEHWEEQY
ncbi:MAG: hypothetical protein WCV92_01140 [Candidatus Buchananbacteria bacterium]